MEVRNLMRMTHKLLAVALICSAMAPFTPTTAHAAVIFFEDEFDTSAAPWTVTLGNVAFKSGDHANAPINTSGTDDHSDVTFDADGNPIATANLHYAALNAGQNVAASISTPLNLTAGTTYNVYFRYAGALSGSQTIRGTMTRGAESATTGTLTAPLNAWTSGNFSFTPTTTGSSTLTFDNVTVPANSDLLLDSVVVTMVPEPSSLAFAGVAMGLGAIALAKRRRRKS